jgi:hypothetical protein
MDEPFPAGMVEEIEKFLANDQIRPPGLDTYDAVFNSNLFFPLQRQAELAEMMRIARSINPVTVMEIGADKGGGLYHWTKCLSTVKNVIACEVRGIPYSGLFHKAFPDKNFIWLLESSHEQSTVSKVQRLLDYARIDCLFIDGDKSMMDKDFFAYLPLMSPNGVVFFHDVQDGVPSNHFDRVRSKMRRCRSRIILDVSDLWSDRRDRLKNPDSPRTPHSNWLKEWNGASCGVGVLWLGG